MSVRFSPVYSDVVVLVAFARSLLDVIAQFTSSSIAATTCICLSKEEHTESFACGD